MSVSISIFNTLVTVGWNLVRNVSRRVNFRSKDPHVAGSFNLVHEIAVLFRVPRRAANRRERRGADNKSTLLNTQPAKDAHADTPSLVDCLSRAQRA